MRQKLLALGLVLTLMLTGCGSLWERDYSSVTVHVQQSTEEEDPNILRAENYQELVSGILHFVEQGSADGTIRLYLYTGDVAYDLEMACQEVLEEDPLGSYALRSVEQKYSRIVSYYECSFQFSYRRSAEEIQSVVSVGSLEGLKRRLHSAMDEFSSSLALQLSYPVEDEEIEALVWDWYYQNPQHALGYPRLTIWHYPDEEAEQQIIELRFAYSETQEELETQSELAREAAKTLTEGCTADAAGLEQALSALAALLTLDESAEASVYTALVEHSADSEGAALAAALLAQQLELDCAVVEGTLDGEAHWWNAVTLSDGETLYFDLSQGLLTLQPGEALLARYHWEGDESLREEAAASNAPAETQLPAAEP